MEVSVRQGLHDTVYQVLDACIADPDERNRLMRRRGIREAMTPRGAQQAPASDVSMRAMISEVNHMVESGEHIRMDAAYNRRRGPAFIDGVIDVVRRHTVPPIHPPPLVRTKTAMFPMS